MTTPFYEELAGSPSYEGNRRNSSSQRLLRVPNSNDVPAMMQALMPPTGMPFAKHPYVPSLIVESFRCEPFGPQLITNASGGAPFYPNGYLFTVNYAVPDFEITSWIDGQINNGIDSDGALPNPIVLYNNAYTYSGGMGGEFLTLLNNSLKWSFDNVNPRIDLGAAVLVPHIQHQIAWHFVDRPNWSMIRSMLGCVNEEIFANAPIGTLLFTGVEFERPFNRLYGNKLFDIKFRFSEKNVGQITNQSLNEFGDGAIGWNWFYRPENSRWEVLWRNDRNAIFFYNNFDNMFVQLPGATTTFVQLTTV